MSDSVKYITDDQGERTAVVLPISDYENSWRISTIWRWSPSAGKNSPFRTSSSSPS
jgi:hypothetical protein